MYVTMYHSVSCIIEKILLENSKGIYQKGDFFLFYSFAVPPASSITSEAFEAVRCKHASFPSQ